MDGHNIFSADRDSARNAVAHLMDAADDVCGNHRFTQEELRLLRGQTSRIYEHLRDCERDQ